MKSSKGYWLSLTVGALALAIAGQAFAQPAPTVSGAELAAGRGGNRAPIPPNPNEPPPAAQGQNVKGMHVFLYGGLKSHNEGQHDYPQFFADWSKLLTAHGAVVSGSLQMPTAEELQGVQTMVWYKGDAGYMTPAEKKVLEDYVKGGGGIIVIHDTLCGPDPAYMASIVGAGKRHGEVNYTLEAPIAYTIVDKSNPIMAGLNDFQITDEAFYAMTFAKSPAVHVLATVKIPDTPSAENGVGGSHVGEVVPQIWTYEHTLPGGKDARAFVWMQGHFYASIQRPDITAMLLRGIAWAGQQPVNELVDYKAPVRAGRGGAAAGGG